MTERASYGSWASALSAEALGAGLVSFDNLRSVGERLYWTENVPAAGGNVVLYGMSADGDAQPLTSERANVRTRVHEYGGAPFVVVGDTIIYSELADQRLYALTGGTSAHALTPPGYRFADCIALRDGTSSQALICVREDHTDPARVRNAIVLLQPGSGGAGEVLYEDSDFVAYPRLSPDGRQLAFITWNHPHMPWDRSELQLAQLGEHGLTNLVTLAGGTRESVLEPQWDADGRLYFISDRSGYWNLYASRPDGVRALWPRAADMAAPLWSLGQANYALLGDGQAVARFGEQGLDRLAVIDLSDGSAQVLDLPYVEYSQLVRIDTQHVGMLAGSATVPRSIVKLHVGSATARTLRSAAPPLLAPSAVSVAVPIEFPSTGGRRAHAFYYAPVNPAYEGPAGELPPLRTRVHGGPTAQASPAYAAAIQFWTSRGFAVLDVNYGGSSGFGRQYRQALEGNWGVVDVEDVIAAARFLGDSGRADPQRTAISGGSAGGFTVLAALCSSDVFRAGADYYGVSDISALARDTHKFESRYLDSLIGALPQAQPIYDARSPLNHLEGFKMPLIVFQGEEDPIVPPNQSALIVEALRARGVPLAYLLFAGESHGFRKPQNIVRSLQAELSFYGQVFGFVPADALPPLQIENLRPWS